MQKTIKRILVANRGEIALRVMRSARELGIETVAVFSEVDRKSPHVREADFAVCIGQAPSAASYLRGDKIIEVCKEYEVDAIHPGYGFLSENAAFAKAVTQAGIIFIGPSPEAIEVMGSKIAAKNAVAARNIPLVPGTKEAITDIEEAKRKAEEIGYPILIKASAGGGGKGMRIVENSQEFESQMERAVSEAVSAFGDGAVFIEKYIASPRHIEVQIIGDHHGQIAYLFERDCSVQRRHQKVVEEAPSAVLTPEIRKAMGECAIEVGRACNYYGAGTVEFIMDEQLNFYFLEMNTRLQVEHPVTELITGIDLVKEQINVAEGKPLTFKQEDLKIQGHAMEIRVYAEDSHNNFLPDIGQLKTYKPPQGAGIRLDSGYEEGMEIPIHYDSMLAKLITYGKDREEAIQRMIRAIDEFTITGVQTTLTFCKFVMQHEAFLSGQFDTKFIEKYFQLEAIKPETDAEGSKIAAAFVAHLLEKNKATQKTSVLENEAASTSNWRKNRV